MKKIVLLLSTAAFLAIIHHSCKRDIEGCTDPLASNYNVDATIEDNTCLYNPDDSLNGTNGDTIWGCTDASASNYNPDANFDDGSCFWYGCMDPNADNYDPQATVDDGSCIDPRIKFAGFYTTSDDCSFPFMLNPNPEFIYDSTVVDTLFIDPFFGAGGTVYAFAARDTLTVPQQTIAIIDFSGTGLYNAGNETVTVNYDWDAGFAGSGTCTAVYSKQ